jgi:hypothetical protein
MTLSRSRRHEALIVLSLLYVLKHI